MSEIPKPPLYASQDAAVARRIGEALGAAGLEVWFDQSELRGGDAWDEKIRRQIAECTLFLPVISETTANRLEGYFRLECSRCHVFGHSILPDFQRQTPVTHNLLGNIALESIYAPRGMGRCDNVLTAADADAIHAYVIEQTWAAKTAGPAR